MHYAGRSGGMSIIELLVEAGADIHSSDDFLERAANEATARLLVDLGVDVQRGLPLHRAVMDEDAGLVSFLEEIREMLITMGVKSSAQLANRACPPDGMGHSVPSWISL